MAQTPRSKGGITDASSNGDGASAVAGSGKGAASSTSKRKRYEPANKDDNQNKSHFEIWVRTSWHAWLKHVTVIAALGLLALLYSTDILSERFVATLMVVGLIGGPLSFVANDLWQRAVQRAKHWRVIVPVFIVAWVFVAGYPAGCAVLPPNNVAQATLTKGQTVHMDASKVSGPIELGIHGSMSGGGGDADGNVVLQVSSNGVTENVSGGFSRHSGMMRVGHKGHGTVTSEKDTDRLPCSTVKGSSDVAVTWAWSDDVVSDQMQVFIHARPYPSRWFIIGGIVLLLFAMFMDGRLADREGSYAAMWLAGTVVFSITLWFYSDPDTLVRPAIGALLTAGFAALPAGALVSWLGDKLFRPASARRRAAKPAKR
jgi:hypothetical protein